MTVCCLACLLADASAEESMVEMTSNLVIQKWGAQEGLPADKITALAQSSDGYLWVGTSGGLARFDGIRFVTFGEAEGMPRMPIERIKTLPDGRLWVLNIVGQTFWLRDARFYPGEENFEEITFGADGHVYGYDSKNIVRLTGQREEFPGPEKIKIEFSEMVMASDASFFLLQLDLHETKIWKRSPQGEWSQWEHLEQQASGIPLVDTLRLLRDSQGAVWAGAHQDFVIRVHNGTETVIKVPWLKEQGFRCMVEDRNGTIWAAPQWGGLCYYKDGTFILKDLVLGRDPIINVLHAGKKGELWAGTEDGGLWRISESVITSYRIPQAKVGKVVALLPSTETPNEILVGTEESGAFVWRPDKISRYAREEKFDEDYPSAFAFLKKRDGILWIGTGQGLHEFRDGVRLTTDDFASQFDQNGDSIYDLLDADDDGALWAARNSGVLNRVRGRTVEAIPIPGLPTAIFPLLKDDKGNLWMALRTRGIARMGKDGNITIFDRDNGIGRASLSMLFQDSKGIFWIGTDGKGLYRFQDGHFFPVHVPGEKQPANIVQIQEDDDGWLWLGTLSGICGIDVSQVRQGAPESTFPLWLGRSEGMASEQCTDMKAVKTPSGELYFGTMNGFVSFDPRKAKATPALPQVIFESLRMNNDNPIPLAGAARSPWRIPPGSRFEIQFNGLSPETIGMAGQIHFRYRIPGLTDQWVETDTRRFVAFTTLPPGDYRLEIQAGLRGEWNEKTSTIKLQVLPFFWQTLWFRLSLLAAGIGAIVIIMRTLERRRLHRLNAQLERKHLIDKERERIARDLHDNLGAGLTLARLCVDELPREPNHNIGGQLDTCLQELTRELDSTVWMTNPSHDCLRSLCDYLISYTQNWLRPSGVKCRMHLPEIIEDVQLTPDTRHHCFQSLKEALNNIIKHSGATEVRLGISIENQTLRISLCDNGQGFDIEEARRRGRNGLGFMEERLASVGGRLELQTSAHGTELTLVLPLSQNEARQVTIHG